jgi:hypothetical protein
VKEEVNEISDSDTLSAGFSTSRDSFYRRM